MTTDTDTSTTSFAYRLRALADLYDANPSLPAPDDVGLYLPYNRPRGFDVARPLAAGEIKIGPESYGYVEVPIGHGFSLNFCKRAVGEERTVLREVVEYVLADPVVTVSA